MSEEQFNNLFEVLSQICNNQVVMCNKLDTIIQKHNSSLDNQVADGEDFKKIITSLTTLNKNHRELNDMVKKATER